MSKIEHFVNQRMNQHITQVTNPVTSHSISKLNNQDLETKLHGLIHQERKLLHLVLLHIKEVDNRKLYLKKAYPSLFEYLTKEYGYSAGSAMRRIEAARLLKDVPQMAQKIQSGEINLSQISEISKAVKEKQRETKILVFRQEKEDLLLKVAGLNTADTQKLVSFELNIKPKELEKRRTQKNESARLELTLSKNQMEKLNRCKDLAAHILEKKKVDASMASVLEVLMGQFLAKRDGDILIKEKPSLQESISTMETNSKEITSMDISSMETNSMEKNTLSGKAFKNSLSQSKKIQKNGIPKTVAQKSKLQIWKRDQCCQYIDPATNKKCNSTYKLEVDHKQPKWAGGQSLESNLQLLCKSHNNFKYRMQSGLIS